MKRILTDEHRRQIIEAERDIQAILPIIDALEDCGTDCGEVREAAKMTLAKLAKLRQHFTLPVKGK